jgi:hypothetical protein
LEHQHQPASDFIVFHGGAFQDQVIREHIQMRWIVLVKALIEQKAQPILQIGYFQAA